MWNLNFLQNIFQLKISCWVKGYLHLIAIQLLILNCCVLWVNTLWFIICKSDISVAHLPSPWYVRHEKKLPTCWLVPLYGNIFFFFVFFFYVHAIFNHSTAAKEYLNITFCRNTDICFFSSSVIAQCENGTYWPWPVSESFKVTRGPSGTWRSGCYL